MTISDRTIAAILFGLSLAVLSGYQTATAGGALGVDRFEPVPGSSEQLGQVAAESDAGLLSDASHKGVLNQNYAILKHTPTITEHFDPKTRVFCADASGWRWEINVITGNKLNAFCLPGDRKIVYSGLTIQPDAIGNL
jgi:hypothetical protein